MSTSIPGELLWDVNVDTLTEGNEVRPMTDAEVTPPSGIVGFFERLANDSTTLRIWRSLS